ncbi:MULTISPECIES: hypothetical protein [unclassified Kosakonia]|uniref:hypothetical protein n=1 Tax=unclassified Kosakonia TaxID=2632876 RepID=UPI0031B6E141
MKITKSSACIVMVLLLSGCTAILWGGNKVSGSHLVNVMKMQDDVTDIFQYENISASVVQDKTNIPLIIPSKGIAFLGEKNVYILTRGADELLSLNKLTDKIPLIAGKEENTLKLQLARPVKGDAVFRFKDSLRVWVNKSAGELSENDIGVIRHSGFQSTKGGYWKDVNIEGMVLPRKSLNYTFTNTESLERKYKVEFYMIDNETDFYPKNLATNIVLTPVALAADIVFFPVSLTFLRLIIGQQH